MGKSMDFTRIETRIPNEQHKQLVKECKRLKVPINACLVAMVNALLDGQIEITKRERLHPFIAKPATVRDVMSGKIRVAT